MSVCLKLGKIIMLLGMLAAFMLSDFARAGAEWQTYPDSTGEFNGTVPLPTAPAYPSIRAVFSLILLNLMMSGFLLNRMNLALTMTLLT